MFGVNSGIEKGEVALLNASGGFGDAAAKGVNGIMEFSIDRVVGSNSPVGEIVQV
jgi:hypothetical protein